VVYPILILERWVRAPLACTVSVRFPHAPAMHVLVVWNAAAMLPHRLRLSPHR